MANPAPRSGCAQGVTTLALFLAALLFITFGTIAIAGLIFIATAAMLHLARRYEIDGSPMRVIGFAIIGVAVLLIGAFGVSESLDELIAAVVVVGGMSMTVMLEMIAYLRKHPAYKAAWRCQRCDYPLVGISRPQCPECGQPVSPQQIRNAPPGIYRFLDDSQDV